MSPEFPIDFSKFTEIANNGENKEPTKYNMESSDKNCSPRINCLIDSPRESPKRQWKHRNSRQYTHSATLSFREGLARIFEGSPQYTGHIPE